MGWLIGISGGRFKEVSMSSDAVSDEGVPHIGSISLEIHVPSPRLTDALA